ncbi:MAG: ATP-binding protein, partial [Gemmatimonadales bacterium]
MTRAEILASSIHDLIVPEQAALLPKCFEGGPEGGVKRSEWRYRRKDGTVFEGEVFSRFLPGGRLQGILRDVTERKRAEAALASSAAALEQLVANDPFGACVVDADFRVALASKGAGRLFTNVRPLVGRHLAEVLRLLWPEPFASELLERFRQVLATGEPHESLHVNQRRADVDAVEAYDWRLERVRLGDGRFGVVCRFYDLTERQRWERRLSAATSVAEVGIFEWQIGPGTIFGDERLRCWWHAAPDAPLTVATILARVHVEDRRLLQERVQAALAPSGPGRFEVEFRVITAGQPLRWVRASGRTEFFDGAAVSMTGGVVDVTRLRGQQEVLRDMDRRKDEFLATLSHELRNPLAPIRSAAELLGHPGVQAEQVTWAQRVIHRQSTHMARLLDDLLDVARITQGKLELRREHVPLSALVDTALETARPAIEARRHAIAVRLPAESLVLDVDPHRMAQVLANLLTNAARYTDPHGRIELRADCEGHRLVITVRDDGMGIPSDQLGAIFEMFAQVEGVPRDRERGLGIGLALVKGLVTLHGGTVAARSEGAGRGSEFVLSFPDTVVVSAAHLPLLRGEDDRAATPARVLVADDNRDAADSLGELLRIAGHDVRVAYGGRDALRAARTFWPHVVLLDVGMPDLSGYHVAMALRAEAWGQAIQLVAVTGWGQAPDRADALAAGFNAHLTKPVEFSALRTLLAGVPGQAAG